MKTFLRFFYDSLREDIGYPATLSGVIDNCQNISISLDKEINSIDAHNVIKWNELSIFSDHAPGTLMGWKYSSGYYESFTQYVDEIRNLCCQISIKNWTCDIQNVVGLSESKSNLDDFTDLDSMVETNSKEMIQAITEENLKKNLCHKEIRILQEDSADYFATYLWDGRIFLMNHGGSHHFAAARYIASRIDHKVPLKGKLYIYSINPIALDMLTKKFDIYAVSNDASFDFNKAMQKFRATYLQCRIPARNKNLNAIFLPKDCLRSMRVSKVFKKSGIFDIGKYLIDLVKQQNINARRLESLRGTITHC